MNPDVVSDTRALRLGSGARLRVKALGGGGGTPAGPADEDDAEVVLQLLDVVLPEVVTVQVNVLVVMFVPTTEVQV